MGKKIGICKYCKEEKRLMKAHVVSHTLFKDIFKNNEPVFLATASDLDKRVLKQDSFYDTGILCEDCDKKFGPFEDYFTQFIRKDWTKSGIRHSGWLENSPGYSLDLFESVDHFKLRMFFLITLWRCSISTQPLFDKIKLSKIEDEIYHQIRSRQLTNYSNPAVVLLSLHAMKSKMINVVTEPSIAILGGRIAYFIVNGWVFIYNLSATPLPDLSDHQLMESDKFKVVKLNQEMGALVLNKLVNPSFSIQQ